MDERLIKSKARVQKHGEVFTPKWLVKKMLDVPEIKAATDNLYQTFLEPAAGEGAFLVEILKRKLIMVKDSYNNSLAMYENYSLLALSTIYGIELLEDNLASCQDHLYDIYEDFYRTQADQHGGRFKTKVRESARTIIEANIVQGDFLKRETNLGAPVVFSEWTPIQMKAGDTFITVQRTEYSLDEIYDQVDKIPGALVDSQASPAFEQLSLFDVFEPVSEPGDQEPNQYYSPVRISDVYRLEMETRDE
ncbi:methylase [Aerococcus urinaehominis]|uniref:Methylase n=1 Tax=Aerococcus urinaehominis TaxID=128944 RepID=A0A109RHH9_9LACT|nr:methylase [Aerococcus urinaehominis]AMB98605.1 methylase [Aerococcus urinaehominis]SDL94921.1 hypothetical protein SAMN04487985_1033 [Aerococcus urinaehominis]